MSWKQRGSCICLRSLAQILASALFLSVVFVGGCFLLQRLNAKHNLRLQPVTPWPSHTDTDVEVWTLLQLPEDCDLDAFAVNTDQLNHSRNAQGHSVLYEAAYEGKARLVQFLLAKGADIGFSSPNEGLTALHAAAYCASEVCVQLLISAGMDVNALDSRSQATPLHYAVSSQQTADQIVSTLKALLSHNANINAQTAAGHSALHMAADGQLISVVEFLLQRGARHSPRLQKCGTTPLMIAAIHCKMPVFEALLEAGSDPLEQCNSGYNTLHIAAMHDCVSAGKFLLSHYNIDINVRTSPRLHVVNEHTRNSFAPNRTPLHVAAARNSVRFVEFLLLQGADQSLMDGCGHTAEDLAKGSVEPRIRQLLVA